jgi:hypothetical protein
MTTRITVTTGDGGLLDRNAQQQAAARQAALVRGQAEKAAALGEAQLRQDRINAGLDPATGRPLPSAGSTSRLTRIDQEPAAFRSGVSVSVTRFYTGIQNDVLYAISGDGSQRTPITVRPPITRQTYPVLENTEYPYLIGGAPFPPPTSTLLQVAGIPGTDTDTEYFWKARYVVGNSYTASFAFPLGDGTCYLLNYSRSGYGSEIARYYRKITAVPPNIETFTIEQETPWTSQEDWVAAVVGPSTARPASVPSAIANVTVDLIYDSGPFETYFAPQGPFVGPDVLTVPSTFERGFRSGTDSYLRNGYGICLIEQEYGSPFTCTPVAWFSTNPSIRSAIATADTHPEFRSVSLSSGLSIGDLFKAKQLIEITEPNARYWSGSALEDNANVFPDPESASWKTGVRVRPNFRPSSLEDSYQSLAEHYAHDWGQPGFCRAQASLFGI